MWRETGQGKCEENKTKVWEQLLKLGAVYMGVVCNFSVNLKWFQNAIFLKRV